MVRRVTADKWEIISRDDTGAMVNIDYICPHCHLPTGNFILIGEHPPCTYPVRGRSSFDLSISIDFSFTARDAFLRSSSLSTGIIKT